MSTDSKSEFDFYNNEVWACSAGQVLTDLVVDPQRGLDPAEVAARQRRYGRNELRAAKRRPALSILADQFRNMVIVLLVVAGGLAFLFAVYVPLLGDLLNLRHPGSAGWLLILGASLVPLLLGPVVRRVAIRNIK